jgi:hypothetical protein
MIDNNKIRENKNNYMELQIFKENNYENNLLNLENAVIDVITIKKLN